MKDLLKDWKPIYKLIIAVALFVGIATACSPVLAYFDKIRGY